jgi:hypothetical protein
MESVRNAVQNCEACTDAGPADWRECEEELESTGKKGKGMAKRSFQSRV